MGLLTDFCFEGKSNYLIFMFHAKNISYEALLMFLVVTTFEAFVIGL